MTQEETQTTTSVPGRVTIAIEAPYLELEPISFSVRCKHTVLAVLKGACKKHFRIDYHRFVCPLLSFPLNPIYLL